MVVQMTSRFLKLPSQFDVHKWQIMEDFASSVEKDSLRDIAVDWLEKHGLSYAEA